MHKNHNIGVNQLLEFIPEVLLAKLSANTNIYYFSKVLHGKKMFYLLLYGIVENEKLSQRSLEDTFNDPVFKLLFNLDEQESVARSSITERLSKINPDYFKQIYECNYEQFSNLYASTSQQKHNLIRVDSSILSDTAGLSETMGHRSFFRFIKQELNVSHLISLNKNGLPVNRALQRIKFSNNDYCQILVIKIMLYGLHFLNIT